METRCGVTRRVFLAGRWAVKVPRVHLVERTPGAHIVHGWAGWALRGWLANRSEWRQRRRPDVARPVLTLAHVVLVFPRADEVGDDRTEDVPGPWSGHEDIEDGRERDERKPSSWGRFAGQWLIIDFDRAWESADRGIIGGVWFGYQERQARKWADA